MPASVVQTKTGSQNTPATAITFSLNAPATAGNELVLSYVGSDLITNVPTGFIEETGAKALYGHGHYIWHKTAVGGEQSISIVPDSASTAAWVIIEVTGIAGAGAFTAAAHRSELAGSGYYFTPDTFQPTAGERFLVGMLSAVAVDSTTLQGVTGYINPFVAAGTAFTTATTGNRYSLGVATLNKTFTASETIELSGGWDTGTEYMSGIIIAFDVGAPDLTNPSVPQNVHITKRTKDSLTVAWTAATDNKAVRNYLVYSGATLIASTDNTTYTLTGLNNATSHSITIRAQDRANNVSGASTALVISTLDGLGKYGWDGGAKHLLGRRVFNPDNALASLPRIPWEGGPAYYEQFSKTSQSAWTNPDFFPIVMFFGDIMTNEEVQYDKALGINTYVNLWEGVPFSLFPDNDVYWIGDKLNDTFPINDAQHWVGRVTDDEIDGRAATAEEGRAYLAARNAAIGNDGRFKYGNYTQLVVGSDGLQSDWEAYVNDYTDVVSLDMYWYTIPYVPYRDIYVYSVKESKRRRSSAYGKMVKSLRYRDSADGKLQPIWNFIEDMNGGPAEGPFVRNIEPGELKGAVMNSIINEARGIIYFNVSFSGPIQTQGMIRQSQRTQNYAGMPQVNAFGEINNQVHRLAEIINTQSYEYTFGNRLDTMLKTHNGFVYIFAMINGDEDSEPGNRTFTLPWGITGTSVEVVEENRTISINSSRQFTDNFQYEYSYHIYKIAI